MIFEKFFTKFEIFQTFNWVLSGFFQGLQIVPRKLTSLVLVVFEI